MGQRQPDREKPLPSPSPRVLRKVQAKERGESDTLCLIVHTRGVIQGVYIWKEISEPIVFQKDFFPSGVSNLLLLTKDMTPISERLIFVNNDDQAKVECRTDKDVYSTRTPVEYTVSIANESGEPLRGNISVSITDDREVIVDTTSNILTSLLLSSDLRGNIPNPAFYFSKDVRSTWALELLMLTQGWRRYDTERIVRSDFMYPDTLLEKGYEISGTVIRHLLARTRPEENANVSVLSFGEFFSENTVTDRAGRFYLRTGILYDSTLLVVQATPQSGKNDLELTLDKPSFPDRKIPFIINELPDKNSFANYADKAERQYVDEHGVRIIHLSEVAITAQKKPVPRSMYYSKPDYSITEEQLDKDRPSSLSILVTRLPGLKIKDEQLISQRCGDDVLIVVDGMPVSNELSDLPLADDIAQVDILTTPVNLTFYNRPDRTPCAVIAIYTRAGKIHASPIIPYIKSVMPLGFQKPAEFYAPKYDIPTQNTKPDLRTTIHWQPSLITDETGTANFSFYTADAPSTYTVVIEGVTDDGKIVYKRDKIVVR